MRGHPLSFAPPSNDIPLFPDYAALHPGYSLPRVTGLTAR
jgi:hypothetical protein